MTSRVPLLNMEQNCSRTKTKRKRETEREKLRERESELINKSIICKQRHICTPINYYRT